MRAPPRESMNNAAQAAVIRVKRLPAPAPPENGVRASAATKGRPHPAASPGLQKNDRDEEDADKAPYASEERLHGRETLARLARPHNRFRSLAANSTPSER